MNIYSWKNTCKTYQMVGSKYILSNGSAEDEDWICIPGGKTIDELKRSGYVKLGRGQQNDYPVGDMEVYRVSKSDSWVDVIICHDVGFYNRFKAAADICKNMYVTDKSFRCQIHSWALYDRPL